VLRFPSAARAAPPLARLDVALDLNTAPLPTLHNACRRCCAQEATPPNARLRNVTFCSLGLDGHPYPWWLPALCFVSGGLRSLFAHCTPTSCVSVGADPALGPRLHKVGSRALRQPTGVGAPSCQHRRLSVLTAVMLRRLTLFHHTLCEVCRGLRGVKTI
jgi:hypothetical protein